MRTRVVLITGTRGAGVSAALARQARARGDLVVGCDVRCVGTAVEDVFVSADVRRLEDARLCVDAAVRQIARIDTLITNACVARRDDRDADDTSPDVVIEAYRDNAVSAYNCAHLVLPTMRRIGGGIIIFLSSVNARCGGYGQVGYAMAKLSLEALWSVLLGRPGLRGPSLGGGRLRSLLRGGLLGSHLSFPFILGLVRRRNYRDARDRQLPREEDKLKRIARGIPKVILRR